MEFVKKSNSQAVSDFRRNRKQNLVRACGAKCCICGYNKAISALEFHHISPEEKEYGIGAKGTCHNIEQDIAEIRKCVLVCANCHREIHEGLYAEIDLKSFQYFDEDVIYTLTHPKTKELKQCIECGKPIRYDNKSGICLDCSRIKQRKVINRPDRDTLKILIQQYPFTQIGVMYGVSDNAIRKWCIAYQLPSKKAEIIAVQDWSKI